MGAIFHEEMIRTTPETFSKWKRRVQCTVVGTSPDVRQDYRSVSHDGPTVLMMGGERTGLSETQRALCDTLVCIPMRCGIDSLNLAVAASVLLYEVWSQRNPVRRVKTKRRRRRGDVSRR